MPWHWDLEQSSDESLKRHLVGSVEDAWRQCLPVWLNSPWNDEDFAHGGRVNDYPFGLHRPRYRPSDATRLGHMFVERFPADYGFLLDRYMHGSPGEKLCAFDLLHFLAYEFYFEEKPLPEVLGNSDLPLLEIVRADLEYEPSFLEALTTFTLGDLLTNVPPLM